MYKKKMTVYTEPDNRTLHHRTVTSNLVAKQNGFQWSTEHNQAASSGFVFPTVWNWHDTQLKTALI